MSTLGGSRGERNAKPKFSALDINSLYRTSRGESLEPLAQKNAVPRKHGMQILGKVPSARRPPANLPSLKAETSTPTQDQSGSWPGAGAQAATSPPSNVNHHQTASSLDKQSSGGDHQQHHHHHQQQQPQQQQQQQHQQQQHHHHQQQQQQQHQQQQQQNYQSKSLNSGSGNNNNSNNNNNNNNNNSASWSSVTSAHEPATQKPLLYQSPQFQHEFPSLDGSNAQAQSKGNRGSSNANQSDPHNTNNNQNANANAADTQLEQNRTQNDGHSDSSASHQQGAGNCNSSTQGQVHQQVVPPQFRALMPTFMRNTISGFDSIPPEQYELHQQQQQQQHQQHQQQQQQQPHMGGNRDNRRNYGRHDPRDQQYHSSYNRNSRDRNDERQYRRGGPPRSNRHDQTPYDDYEPEYQSIIKEEELDRIDIIVGKEDGWVQDAEIDYNQKLVFSDDDSDTPPPMSKNKDAKRVNFNDRDKDTKSTQRRDEQAALNRESEREKLDREHNERNEREKSDPNRLQQNGHRSGAPIVDADLLERVKQRKEEEEKRANERRLAAAKKLQELEQKINKKKELSGGNESDSNAPSSAPAYGKAESIESRTADRYRTDDGKMRENTKDSREYGNRYGESKFERDIGDRSRDRGAPIAAGDPFFNKPYQSNLPPRFQKQRDQQDRHPYKDQQQQPPHRSGPRDPISRRPNQSMQQPPHIMKRNVDDIRDSKYYNKGNPASGAYSTHSKTSSSGVCESEDDDRVSSGRESISRSSAGERTTHLGRTTSDSSQIEIKERIGSWADEMESDSKQPLTQRQLSSTSSTSANDDNQPKQILQRVRKVSIDSRSDKEKSEERELSLLNLSNVSNKSLDLSQEDVIKQFGTSPSMIEAPKSWGDSVPTTPEIARKTIEILSDSSIVTAKITDTDKKPLESVLENEACGGISTEKKLDEKPAAKTGRGYTSSHSKDTYSSDDGKHGNALKRPNARGGRNDTRGGSTRNYGANTSYRGNSNSNWNNRRGRPNRYHDYSESEGSDDEYHGRGNRAAKDERFKHDSSNRRDGQQSHQKDVFVPRGEPSRRGRGGRAGGPIVKRIDNYGPPNAKSPFGTSDEKAESKPETITEEIVGVKSDIQLVDQNVLHAIDSADTKVLKVDDKKVSAAKPTFSGSSQAPQRKDSTGQKVESQTIVKSDDGLVALAQVPPPQRIEKTPPFVGDKQQQSQAIGTKPDKMTAIKKDDLTYAHGPRGNAAPSNRGKPQVNAQTSIKPVSQTIPAKPIGSSVKTPSNVIHSQQPGNVAVAVGGGNVINRQQQQQQQQQLQQQPNKMAPRFVKQPRTGSNSSNTWEKSDITHIGDTNESDFTQRSNSTIQSIDKLSQDNKTDSTTKMSTIIFENTNFKSIPGPIKRQTVPSNQQQIPNSQQPQRSGVHQYDQVQSNNLGGHHSHHPQNQHHLDKKVDDVFKNASSGNFQDMLDSQQQMQAQVQRPHPSQTDVISSALQTMSFPKTDVSEYEKDLKLAFTFESEILNDTQSSDKSTKGSLCIPPSRSSAIHSVASGQNTISPSIADLSKKITSVKKVWETVPSMPTVIEQHGNNSNNSGNNDDSHLTSTFVSAQNQQHMHQFTHTQQQLHQTGLASYSNSFGPDPGSLDHFSKSGGPDGDMDNVGYNPSPQHMVGGNNNSHPNAGLKHNDPLSATANVCKVKPNQPPMHQSSLGLSPPPMQQGIQTAPQPYYQPSQFGGMSAIPSPPAVLYNSTPMPSQYGHYERYIASAHYGGGNAAPYNAQYMQSGPNLQAAPAPDMYQNVNMTSQFRMSGAINQPPYNQQQQMNNQSTVLISSTSNSLMSASVKPSSQIGAIGTKVNAGQTQYAQQYMGMYAPPQQPPPQNNSYNNYNNSYFGAPNANYGIQATGIFGPQAQPPSNASMNQQPVANYGNFLAINRQYQSQQNNAYSQQPSSRSQQQQNPNQSQSQPPSGQQSQQQSNSSSQNQSGPPQSHSQDSVSNSFFK